MVNHSFYFKALLTSVITAMSLRFHVIGDLLWLFLAAVILDYVTGIAAATLNKELNSRIGLRGVLKKVGECFVIAVALLTDEVVSQSAEQLGITYSTGGAIAAIVTIWLVLNELISILENVAKMNVPLPPFLMSAIRLLKKQAEAKGESLAPTKSDVNPS